MVMEGDNLVELAAEEKLLQQKKMFNFRRICVFCGSQSGKKASYQEAAIELGNELVPINSSFSFLVTLVFSFLSVRFVFFSCRRNRKGSFPTPNLPKLVEVLFILKAKDFIFD